MPPLPEAADRREQSGDGISARRVALTLLDDIFFRRRNLDEALAGSHAFETLRPRDRAFVRLLVATVLRHARQMDAVLQHFLHEPLSALKPPSLVNIFRLGIAQLVFLKTAPHAAVNTTVALAEATGITHQKPLVNAIMRRLTREGFPAMTERDAGKFNTPEWLWTQWMQDYGIETALQMAATHFSEAPLDITVKDHAEQWAERLGAALLPTGSLRKSNGGFIPDMPGFAEGQWWIQNAAAALPAKLFGILEGKTIVDLCAAPGGKTAQLATAGAHVIAVDRSAERLKRLRENMDRLHLAVETVVADGAAWLPKAPVDAVLLDAPCTATGTIRHQPDILHLKTLNDQEKLVMLQRRLLVNAVKMLKPGGILIYCTCSLQKAEGEGQIDWLLSQNLPVQRSPVMPAEISGIADMITGHGDIRSLPLHWAAFNGIDGFFIARLIRHQQGNSHDKHR
ncbi:MAG: RsmB/NOP family class I SAM-dependent RNA methyltransferase [Proteobacteria bacterium]|nr:RsmB/NOP family class I SAM-dependent RNA methyltransferase [Pseudomonadota bacterium]